MGMTEDVSKRIDEHNAGYVKSTMFHRPFELFFVQITDNRLSAHDLEKHLKVRWNKESLIGLYAGMAKLVDAQS